MSNWLIRAGSHGEQEQETPSDAPMREVGNEEVGSQGSS